MITETINDPASSRMDSIVRYIIRTLEDIQIVRESALVQVWMVIAYPDI